MWWGNCGGVLRKVQYRLSREDIDQCVRTAIVLNTDGDVGLADGVADVSWGGSIDLNDLVRGGVVCGTGGHTKKILICHCDYYDMSRSIRIS